MIAVVFLAFWLGLVAAFCGVGGWAAWSLGGILHDTFRARSWVGVKATVERVSLEAPLGWDPGSEEAVQAWYRYEFGGRPYGGTRLGFSAHIIGDSFDGWHRDTYARLERAKESGTPVVVWVDPANPGEAVLDRTPRWGDFTLLPMALVFGGGGLGALWPLLLAIRDGRRQKAAG